MATAMFLEWSGLTAERYEQLRPRVIWERDVPQGILLHVATFGPEGARIADVWESEDAWRRFLESRIMPAVQEAGVPGEPRVEFRPVHALFTPAIERKS